MEFWKTIKNSVSGLLGGGGNIISKWDLWQELGKPVMQKFMGIRPAPMSHDGSKPPPSDAIKADASGINDEQALLMLLTYCGLADETLGPELKAIEVTREHRVAIGYLLDEMTDGEAATFKDAIARGGEQPITVKIPVKVALKKTNPKTGEVTTKEEMGHRETVVYATIRGSHILRVIGDDIIEGNSTERKQRAKAREIVESLRKAGILRNWTDLAKKVWEKIKEAKPGTSVYALRQEVYFRWRLGNEGFNYIYHGTRAQAFQVEIDAATTPQAKAIAERRYWDYFGAEAERVLDPEVQREAARAQDVVHPNKLLWRVVFGVMGFILIGFAAILAIASIN